MQPIARTEEQPSKGELKRRTSKITVPVNRNINDVLGLYPLQESLVIGRYVKMLARRVLSDRYRRTQEKFQYHGV